MSYESPAVPAVFSTSSSPSKAGQQSFKIVVFKLVIEEVNRKLDYGVRIEQVQEIGTVGSITRVPGASSYVRGVMNLRGKIINIIDMKEKLGFKPISNDKLGSARILVAQIENRLIGVLVDEVDQVLEISNNELETSAKVVPVDAKYFGGIAKHGDRLIVLLELEEIFSLKQAAVGNDTTTIGTAGAKIQSHQANTSTLQNPSTAVVGSA